MITKGQMNLIKPTANAPHTASSRLIPSSPPEVVDAKRMGCSDRTSFLPQPSSGPRRPPQPPGLRLCGGRSQSLVIIPIVLSSSNPF